ncbi:MAG: 5'/3'-nucleotidase SurE [Epsilonproteobacteria bacterium]|nr:5'/3'-nucleotidase SurE [Campylobacterota bacterium]
MKKKILITNDDGFESPGLKALIEALKPFGEIYIVAPTIEKSACGHSLTLSRPLRFIEIDKNFYKLDDGTPSDCIFLALNKLFKDNKPDLVVSGINIGANMGEDITYSGTVAAAMEGVLQGVPSIAISQVCRGYCKDILKLEFKLAKEAVAKIVDKIFKNGFPLQSRELLNINIPPVEPRECKGYKITHAGRRVYGNDAQVHINPRGIEYYWIGLPKLDWHSHHIDGNILSDFEAIKENFISITPIMLDLTAYKRLDTLKSWLDET